MNGKILDLESRLSNTSDLSERAAVFAALATELRDSEPRRALSYSQQACELWSALQEEGANLDHRLIECRALMSECNYALGNYGVAISLSVEGLGKINELADASLQVRFLINLASAYEQLGDYMAALEYTLDALRLARGAADLPGKARALSLIGVIYNRTGDYYQEVEVHREALEIYRSLAQPGEEAAVYNNLALAYSAEGEHEKARENAIKSLELARSLGLTRLEATACCTVGEIALLQGQHEQALAYFDQGARLASVPGYRNIALGAQRATGRVLLLQGNVKRGLEELQSALSQAVLLESKPELDKCHHALAEAYRQAGDYEKAYFHLEQSQSLREAIYSDEADKKIRNLQVIFETESAKTQAELYRLRNVELEQEVALRRQAEAELQRYAQELEVQNAELDAFAHTVAHDLKGLVSSLLIYSEMPESMFSELPVEMQHSVLSRIAQGGRKMVNVIDELMLLASIRKQEVRLAPVDTRRVVESALERLRDVINRSQAEILLPTHWPDAIGYDPWIEEVWVNYLSNGIKYGGRPPVLELGAFRWSDQEIRFWVRDNGPGIGAAEQAILFTPFERLGQVKTEGQGLGLSVVRRIMEKLGGRAGVESPAASDGRGSLFYFELPQAGS